MTDEEIQGVLDQLDAIGYLEPDIRFDASYVIRFLLQEREALQQQLKKGETVSDPPSLTSGNP